MKKLGLKIPSIKIDNVPLRSIDKIYAVELGSSDWDVKWDIKERYSLDVPPSYIYLETYDREQAGKYNGNNGVICFITDEGVFATPYAREIERNLQMRGFESDFNIEVPLSNGEEILDPKLEKRWRELLEVYRE